ncbi:hypothetical protein AK812_SmicGene26557 [Symbiodinium microadriaticum]|uniref:Uncharacterized protein n=1 Tax=Symbiodinium microadriaticum TaxID=2951 RepID=A0A1Q9D971_SYMMI|nr:hypothetical protein AK812_SmicGene26557 [Symbiodinium microadriaticum]
MEEVRAYNLLRHSQLPPEDKKRVVIESEDNLKYKEEPSDEDLLCYFLDINDEDATYITEFEDSIVDAIQGSELAPVYETYQEARQRLREKAKARGYWPAKGRGKRFGQQGNESKVEVTPLYPGDLRPLRPVHTVPPESEHYFGEEDALMWTSHWWLPSAEPLHWIGPVSSLQAAARAEQMADQRCQSKDTRPTQNQTEPGHCVLRGRGRDRGLCLSGASTPLPPIRPGAQHPPPRPTKESERPSRTPRRTAEQRVDIRTKKALLQRELAKLEQLEEDSWEGEVSSLQGHHGSMNLGNHVEQTLATCQRIDACIFQIEEKLGKLHSANGDFRKKMHYKLPRLDVLEVTLADSGISNAIRNRQGRAVSVQTMEANRIWFMIHMYEPKHLWINCGRQDPSKIFWPRELLDDLYEHQIEQGRHFHVCCGQNIFAESTPELQDVMHGTMCAVHFPSEVMGLGKMSGNKFLNKKSFIYTTSRAVHEATNTHRAKRHLSNPGQLPSNTPAPRSQTWQLRLAEHVAAAMISDCSVPLYLSELLVTNLKRDGDINLSNHAALENAQQVVKRRRLLRRQPPEVQELIPQFEVKRVVMARGTNRVQPPKPGLEIQATASGRTMEDQYDTLTDSWTKWAGHVVRLQVPYAKGRHHEQ